MITPVSSLMIGKGMKKMSWFDLLLMGVVAVLVIGSLIHGVLKQLFNLVGFLIVLALAFMGSPYRDYAATWIERIRSALAFMGSLYLGGFITGLLPPEYFISRHDFAEIFRELREQCGERFSGRRLLEALSIAAVCRF